MRLNWSTLKLINTSPKYLQWRVKHPRPETAPLRIGRAIHCLILEPDEFESRWISTKTCAGTKKDKSACSSMGTLYFEGEWYCRVKGHAPKEAGNPPEGVEIILPDERELVKFCADAVWAHGHASKLLKDSKTEHSIEWQDPETGIACRGRMDSVRPNFLTDLKSTRRETVREFTMDAARGLYHGQLAWYHDGAIAAGRLPADAELPYVVSVSTSEPYDVAAYQLSRSSFEAGQILYRDLLLKYAQCQAAEMWPGIAPDLLTLDLPDWAPGMYGSEEGIGNDW